MESQLQVFDFEGSNVRTVNIDGFEIGWYGDEDDGHEW